MITAARLAETEYAAVSLPGKVVQTPIGRFVHDARFAKRQDANQLFDARLSAGVTAFFEKLEQLYAPLDLPYRKLCGHEPESFEMLLPALEQRGYISYPMQMMTHQQPAHLPINADVVIKAVDSRTSAAAKGLWPEDVYSYILARDSYLGGETILAYLGSEVVGSTGWFVVGGIARFRAVYVVEAFRKQGVASTMLQYVQNHPAVKAQDALTIQVAEDGPVSLYERLGFVKHSPFWEAVKRLD